MAYTITNIAMMRPIELRRQHPTKRTKLTIIIILLIIYYGKLNSYVFMNHIISIGQRSDILRRTNDVQLTCPACDHEYASSLHSDYQTDNNNRNHRRQKN